jgi:hypothetical protein
MLTLLLWRSVRASFIACQMTTWLHFTCSCRQRCAFQRFGFSWRDTAHQYPPNFRLAWTISYVNTNSAARPAGQLWKSAYM